MLHSSKTIYQRNLPHFVPPGAILFVTFRLTDSLPAEVVIRLQEEAELTLKSLFQQPLSPEALQEKTAHLRKQHFGKFDAALDASKTGPQWLRDNAIATVVITEIQQLAKLDVEVVCYCLMPNHVRLVVQLPEVPSFSYARMMQRLKGRTAVANNRLLGRTGAFWQHESYDHVVRRGEELQRVVAYGLNNPVKAGLVDEWTQWPYSYWNEM